MIGKPGSEPQAVAKIDARPDRIARLIAVINGETPDDELREDLAACLDAVAIMDAAYRSARTGAWEQVQKF